MLYYALCLSYHSNTEAALFEVPPMVVAFYGDGWALRAGIGMTTNLPVILCQWHSTILTTNDCTILFGLLSTHLHYFKKKIECDIYV